MTTGSLSGVITDSSGALIPGARVVATHIATGVSQKTEAGATGRYEFPFLQPGDYRVEVEKEGFSRFRQTGLTIQVASASRLDVSLRVGAVNSLVEVLGQAPLIQAEHAAVGQVVEEKQFRELPLNGRNPFALINLAPQKKSWVDSGSGSLPSE